MDTFLLKCDAISGRPRVLAFRGEEELGQCFDYEVWFTVDDDSSLDVDPRQVLGEPATLTLGENAVEVSGRVAELELLEEAPAAVFRMRLVPALWFLRLSSHGRVFVGESVPDILKKVLEEAGITADTFELRLNNDYAKRDHVCQYHESDLDFVQRWMEREGLYYFFDHSAPDSKLVICDATSHHAPIRENAVAYHPVATVDESSGESFASFHTSWTALPKEVAQAEYNYLTPDVPILATEPVAPELGASVQEWAENEADDAAAKRLAKIRKERELCRRKRHVGRGAAFGVHSGATFTLDRHPEGELNREYLAVRVTLRGQRAEQDEGRVAFFNAEESAELARTVLSVEVEAIDSDIQYRPLRRTPWPRASGLELGIVDGAADDDYAQLDDHGRYFVKLMMDENQSPAGRASMRVRMIQPHGGKAEGWHLPLRKGTEVLIAFVGGDADRPVIAAAVPNTHTPSPVTRANGTLNVLQTGGLSRVEMEDTDGKQYIDISTPPEKTYVHLGAHAGLGDHNIVLSTDGDGLIRTGGNRDITIDAVQNEDVQGSLTETYHANQSTNVAAAFKETIDAGATQTIHAGSTQTITGGLTQTIDGGEQRTVSGGMTETINGSRTQTINGGTTETISAAQTQTVGGSTTVTSSGTYTVKADGGIVLQTTGPMNMMANTWLMSAPGGQTNVDNEKLVIATMEVKTFGMIFLPNAAAVAICGLAIGGIGQRRDAFKTKLEAAGIAIQNKGVSKTIAEVKQRQKALSLLAGFMIFL